MFYKKSIQARSVAVLALAVLAGGGLAGCASGQSEATSAGSEFTFWDPYPQYDASSAWAASIDKCGSEAGATINRTAYDTSDLTSKALLAGQQGSSPDVLLVDNPVVSTLAEAGVLTSAKDSGMDASQTQKNLLAAGEIDGDVFGVPIGANTLALYYNPEVLKAAGVDPASVTDWDSLNAALEKVKSSGKKGITFSAVGTEEGSFQFLPWFWGSGAQLDDLSSSDAVSALALWTDWIEQGHAPNSVINNTQTTSWQEFMAGDFAFAENGTWQKADAAKAGYEVMPIPAKSGGPAAAPTGGEFLTIPVQKETGRYETSKNIVACLTSAANVVDTDNTLNYIAPTQEAQKAQLAADATLKPWIDAVAAAKGRTSDNLGTDYPKISEQLWTAVQASITGSASPEDAAKTAQSAAAAATK